GRERAREREVVAVVRPEEIEIAASRDNLATDYLAAGKVEEILFSGALERLRVRLDAGAGAHVMRMEDGSDEPYIEVSRAQHEQRFFPLVPGQNVALGVRRLHVLPTPLSSFRVCAAGTAQAEALARQPLLTALAGRMKTRIAVQVEPSLETASAAPALAFGGAMVIGPAGARTIEWVLEHGAEEVLVLPDQARAPQRVLIHWVGESARRATLAVSASLLRHVSAEAVYIGILPEDGARGARRPIGMRALLDARSEAQAIHGLDMRTELRFGDVASELGGQLAESPDQLLVLGIDAPAQLEARFAALLAALRCPLLVVCPPGESALPRVPASTAGELRFA
ncbi:MAG: hypothetical protein ACRET2_04630, partial [Steroidobacteraceae bacterium]